jgi:putative ABC transport system ATP-binding protein
MATADAMGIAGSELIRLDEIHKIYDTGETQVHALRGVSLRVSAGEFVAVMGASGSGKTTLMNIVGCLDGQSLGDYFLEGTDVLGLDKHALAALRNRQFGFVFQDFNLLARTTAFENVAMPTLYSRMTRQERARRAMKALSLVGLERRKDHFPAQMSGGEQQRVAIARALVNDPSILIADEPTGNLDSHTAADTMDMLRELNNQGLTIFMVTHDPDIAKSAKRTILIRDGVVLKDEPVSDAAGLPDAAARVA